MQRAVWRVHAVRVEQYPCENALVDDCSSTLSQIVTIWNSVVPGIGAGI
jgi:hypothetical protein